MAVVSFFLSSDRQRCEAFVYREGSPFHGESVDVELDERTRETVRQALLAVLDAANEQERNP